MKKFINFFKIIPKMAAHRRGCHEAFKKGNFSGVMFFKNTENTQDFLGFEMTDVPTMITSGFRGRLPLQSLLHECFKNIDMTIDFGGASNPNDRAWICRPA